jgi:hypothetical protein
VDLIQCEHGGRRIVDGRRQGLIGDVDHDAKGEPRVLLDRAFGAGGNARAQGVGVDGASTLAYSKQRMTAGHVSWLHSEISKLVDPGTPRARAILAMYDQDDAGFRSVRPPRPRHRARVTKRPPRRVESPDRRYGAPIVDDSLSTEIGRIAEPSHCAYQKKIPMHARLQQIATVTGSCGIWRRFAPGGDRVAVGKGKEAEDPLEALVDEHHGDDARRELRAASG